jgi:hypothetical protein
VLTGLRHITSTGWTTIATPDASVRSFDLRTIGTALVIGAAPFIAFDILLIATGILTLQIIGTLFFGLTAYALFARKAVSQEVRLEGEGLELQRGIGPPRRVPYADIVAVKEVEWKLSKFGRLMNWLGSLRTGEQRLGYPYVRVFTKYRVFRIGWIPYPVPTYKNSLVLNVWQTTELVEELQARIPPQIGWTIPTPRTA